jgi:hypothetical protein
MTNERRYPGDAESRARFNEMLIDMANIALFNALTKKEDRAKAKEKPDDGSDDQGPQQPLQQ